MKQAVCLLLLLTTFSSCEIKLKSDNKDTTKEVSQPSADTNSDADILHTVSLHESGGVKVGQPFLRYEDGKLIPKTHKVRLGETVFLNLMIDKGWEIRDGRSSIDASEIITTSDGQIVLNARNLFKDYPTLDANDAKQIALEAVITKTSKKIDHFIINYHVWDNWGNGEVKGSYKLYIDAGTNGERP